MVAQGAQAEFHGQKKRARHLSFNVIRNLENFVGICCATAVHTSGRDGKRQLDKRISGGGRGRGPGGG